MKSCSIAIARQHLRINRKGAQDAQVLREKDGLKRMVKRLDEGAR
jgi:hypothetical protein